jgi:pimeloyl-ACP methyl ester carboxylesterase
VNSATTTFVLVPGAWLGGWAWNKVTPLLTVRGHKVYPVTLTGMGERVHLSTDNIGIETAIQDVLNVIRYNDLENLVLVGHSFAGKVAAAAADRVADKVGMILYLDGFSPEKVRTPQGSFPDEFPVNGSTVPFPKQFLDTVGKDVQGGDLDWMTAKASPTPVGYLRDPIRLSAKIDSIRTSYIYCSGADTISWYMSQFPGRSVDEVLRSKLDGPYRIIDSGHWPMITKPNELVEDMLELTKSPTLQLQVS